MKCTNNGLKKFPKERDAIMLDIQNLISGCLNNKGHLGDVIACIETTISSLKIKSERLKQVFIEQKNNSNDVNIFSEEKVIEILEDYGFHYKCHISQYCDKDEIQDPKTFLEPYKY